MSDFNPQVTFIDPSPHQKSSMGAHGAAMLLENALPDSRPSRQQEDDS